MEPASIITGGAIVTLFIWIFIGSMMYFEEGSNWCLEDWKVFVIGLFGCLIWPITVPAATYVIYHKRKG